MGHVSVDDWQELSRLYEHAHALDAAELQPWLDALPAPARRLVPQLRRMLDARADAERQRFLATLPGLAANGDADEPAPSPGWRAGDRLGPWRLIDRLGSGGMSEVWRAERADGSFRRHVAVKLLFEHAAGRRPAFVERFRRERDFLAALDHPNIAALHDAGVTEGGVPWLALELVEGAPITAWADAARLPVRARVEAFVQVVRAVEAAHAKLVVHRDIKPSNILVGADGRPQLLDFGIAKLLDDVDTSLTRQGGQPLTLQYASPEQIAGRPMATSTDVYSLGLVLYELLSGERPYDVAAIPMSRLEAELERRMPARLAKVRAGAPVAEARGTSARALEAAWAGDLDAIVAQALRPDPAQRYGSAEAMRTDLERWLDGRPVAARRAGAWYVAGKFARRHRLAVSVSAAALAVVVAAAGVALWQSARASSEATRAVAARDFVFDIFRDVGPERTGGAAAIPAAQVLVAGRDKAVQSLADQPALLVEVLSEIGRMQRTLGEYREAEVTYERLVGVARGSVRSALPAAMVERAYNVNQLGDATRARALIGEAAGVEGGVAALAPDVRSRYWHVKGLIEESLGNLDTAMHDLGEALALATAHDGRDRMPTLRILRALAQVESERGEYERALQLLGDAAAGADRAHADARDRFAIELQREEIESLAGHYAGQGGRLVALAYRCEQLFGRATEHCVVIANLRAVTMLRTGDRDGALATLPVLRASADNDASPRRQMNSLENLVRVLNASGRFADAAVDRIRLRAMAENGSQAPEERAWAWLALAEGDLLAGEPEAADRSLDEANDLQRRAGTDWVLFDARARVLSGLTAAARGDHRVAIERITEAADRLARALGAQHPLVAAYRLNAAPMVLRTAGRGDCLALLDRLAPPITAAFGADAALVERMQRFRRSVAEGGGTSPLASPSDFLV